MGDLATLPTFAASPTAYTHNDLNAIFQALTIAPGAVTFSKFQSVATAVMLGRITGGNGSVEALTPAQARGVMGLGDMALQNAAAVAITGGTGVLDTLQLNHLTFVPESGYATTGAIALALNAKNNARILLTGNATFSLTGIAAGEHLLVALKNTTGGDLTLTWPALNETGAGLPKRLAAGESALVVIRSFGSTLADVFASAGPEATPTLENIVAGALLNTVTAAGSLVWNGGPTITLTRGTWLVFGTAPLRTTDATAAIALGLHDFTNTVDFGQGTWLQNESLGVIHPSSAMGFITVTANTVIRLKCYSSPNRVLEIGAVNGSGVLRAIRIHG